MQQVKKTETTKRSSIDEPHIADLRKKIIFYETILDSIRNGIMITDRRGRIIFFSKTYGEFLGNPTRKGPGKELHRGDRKHADAYRRRNRGPGNQ